MQTTDVVVIGAGQCGLAASRCLSTAGVDHRVVERGRVAESWRSERWDSLRLLTPNWQSRLVGWQYRGADPDGFMGMTEVTGFLEGYAASFQAPVHDHTAVLAVRPSARGYRVDTDRGRYDARQVIVATGAHGRPYVPTGCQLPSSLTQLTPTAYRNPCALPPGGVLVVGASASGLQVAHELNQSGRPVTVAVGRHTRLPRRYRGHDIMVWLDAMGILGRPAAEIGDLALARAAPSPQLVAGPDTLDLPTLQAAGIEVVGRLLGGDGARLTLADDLGATTRDAELRLGRLRRRIDRFVERRGIGADPVPPPPRRIELRSRGSALDLHDRGITTVVWATGFRPHTPWLQVPGVLDPEGHIVHREGLTPAPGLYVLGLPLLRTRKSTWLDGAGDDARSVCDAVVRRLAGPQAA